MSAGSGPVSAVAGRLMPIRGAAKHVAALSSLVDHYSQRYRFGISAICTVSLVVSGACASVSDYRTPEASPENLATLILVVDNSYSRANAPFLRALVYDFGTQCPPAFYGANSKSYRGALWLRDDQSHEIQVRAKHNVFIASGHVDSGYECDINFGFVLAPEAKYIASFTLGDRRCEVRVTDELGRHVPLQSSGTCTSLDP